MITVKKQYFTLKQILFFTVFEFINLVFQKWRAVVYILSVTPQLCHKQIKFSLCISK